MNWACFFLCFIPFGLANAGKLVCALIESDCLLQWDENMRGLNEDV